MSWYPIRSRSNTWLLQAVLCALLATAHGFSQDAPNPSGGAAQTVKSGGKQSAPNSNQSNSKGSNERIPIAGASEFVAREQSRLRNTRPQGNPASISLFGGQTSTGRSFVFLIDRSKSTGSEGAKVLDDAEKELLRALQALQPHHQFQVIAYNDQCAYLKRRELLAATEENKQAVKGFVSRLTAAGATEHEMALQSALYQQPDVIYLLSDAGLPELTDVQIRKITKLAGTKTEIHCVQFGSGALKGDSSFLSRLAAMNRGSFTYIDTSRPK